MTTQQPVHAWPLIVLTYRDDGAAIATSGTKRSTVRASEAGSLEDAACAAAVEVCKQLGRRRCRVEGIADDDAVFAMVVDVDAGTLEPLEDQQWGASPAGGAPSRNRGGRMNRRTLVMVGSGGLLGAAVLLALGSQLWGGDDNGSAPPPPPDAAQLPITAPAGWSTYAVWAAPSEDVPAVLDGSGRLLVVEDGQLVARAPKDGQEIQRIDLPFTADAVKVYSEGDQERVAVASGRELAVMDQGADGFSTVEVPEGGQVSLEGSDPLVTSEDQRAWVLEGTELRERIVPAGAEALAADDGALVAANGDEGKVWKITTSDPELPDPASIEAPEDYEIAGIPAANGSRVAVTFRGDEGHKVALYEVTAGQSATEATELTQKDVDGVSSAGQAQWDPAGEVAVMGSVAVDFKDVTIAELPDQVEAGGGDLWVPRNDEGRSQRYSSAGTELDSGDGDAAVPSVVTEGGLAVVVEGERVYALTDDPPAANQASEEASGADTSTNEASNEGEDQ